MSAVKKPESIEEIQKPDVETARTDVNPIDDALKLDATPAPSPALALQQNLNKHYAPVTRHMSARYVSLLVMLTCLGTWVSGVGLYATL